MGNDISKLSGANGFNTVKDLKEAMKQNDAVHFGENSKRNESIFGEDGLQAGATKDDFLERFKQIGLDEDIANACWEVLNIDSDGDSADVIDEEELDKLMTMFGSDAKSKKGDEIDKITLGSLYTKLDSSDTSISSDKSNSEENSQATDTASSNEIGVAGFFQSILQGITDGLKNSFNFTPIMSIVNTLFPSLTGGNTSQSSSSGNEITNAVTSALSESANEIGGEIKSSVTSALVDGAKSLISDLFKSK